MLHLSIVNVLPSEDKLGYPELGGQINPRGSVPLDVRLWQHISDMPRQPDDVRSPGQGRHPAARPRLPFLTDCVEKLENRRASKISQMMHVGDSSRRKVCRIDTSVGIRFCCI
jgi:hypothetical protein